MAMDHQVLYEWYEQYGYAVHRRCLRLLGSEAEADDALQEVFLRVHKYRDSLRAEEDPLGWIYRVADRHCFDVLQRGRRVASAAETGAALETHAAQVDYGQDLERTQLVGQVLAACKPRERDAARLYYVDELTQDEVALQLGISRKTVKEKLLRFRQVAFDLLGIPTQAEDIQT